MKKNIALICALVLLLSGCAAPSSQTVEEHTLSVITSVFPPFDFVREIGGEHVAVTMLLRPGAESHSYEPTPQDLIAIQSCDLFIDTGGEGDSAMEKLVGSIETPHFSVLHMEDSVTVREEELVDGMQAEHEHEEEEGEVEYDEHVWTSPRNAMLIGDAICEELCRLDEDHAADFRANWDRYRAEIAELDAEFAEIVAQGARNTVVFADRFPFLYFCKDYGLDYFAAFPGCSSETEPSVATMAFLIDKVKAESIPVVFTLEFSNKNIANAITRETGAQVLEFHSCHNVSASDRNNGVRYADLMRKNAEHLKAALQ